MPQCFGFWYSNCCQATCTTSTQYLCFRARQRRAPCVEPQGLQTINILRKGDVFVVLTGSPDDNLAEVWGRIKSWYHDNGSRGHYSNMHIGMFTQRRSPNSTYPKMRGRACEIKMLGRPLLAVWQRYRDVTSVVHGQIRLLLKYSVELETTLSDTSDLNCLPPDIFEPFMTACNNFLVLYSAVHSHFTAAEMYQFNLIPKVHLLYHACWTAQWLHPRMTWCYMGPNAKQSLARLRVSYVCMFAKSTVRNPGRTSCKCVNMRVALSSKACVCTRRGLHAAQPEVSTVLPPRCEEVARDQQGREKVRQGHDLPHATCITPGHTLLRKTPRLAIESECHKDSTHRE